MSVSILLRRDFFMKRPHIHLAHVNSRNPCLSYQGVYGLDQPGPGRVHTPPKTTFSTEARAVHRAGMEKNALKIDKASLYQRVYL